MVTSPPRSLDEQVYTPLSPLSSGPVVVSVPSADSSMPLLKLQTYPLATGGRKFSMVCAAEPLMLVGFTRNGSQLKELKRLSLRVRPRLTDAEDVMFSADVMASS